MLYTGIEYDAVRAWIRNKRERFDTCWDDIMLACKKDEKSLEAFLQQSHEDYDWPNITVSDWRAIVEEQKSAEEETKRTDMEGGAAIIHAQGQNSVYVPTNPSSSWQTYREGLAQKGFKESTICSIERSTLRILRHLSLDTIGSNAKKGMVIGNVQSGKTANMAALMAMAADWGWNMFIILSGTIDNLRKQTEGRLFSDLNNEKCLIDWQAIDHPRANQSAIRRASALRLSSKNHAYFTVCLKNKSRLKELIRWLQEDKNTQRLLKILVIDDEADQAGINTADVETGERKAINQLICNLVNGKTWDGHDIQDSNYQAMNYIGYTATPYANVLNECSLESLYPRDFIATLNVSKEYFGPQQIFGCDDTQYEGLNIVRTIDSTDVTLIKDLHKSKNKALPESLKRAVYWFVCGVACLRVWKYRKPISMLIHTSQRTDHHENVAGAIETWIKGIKYDEFIDECRKVWTEEIDKYSLEDFLEQYPDYGIDADKIKNYPAFEDISSQISDIINAQQRISNIELSAQNKLKYHNGIHLCVDNCRNNGNDNGMVLRLVYPENDAMPTLAPAFIVVGGATLSRGLTIEGLISTYFLRSIKQSDTLMQMGRWFGYRKGYELLPRIWLSNTTQKQFQFLALLDQKLRDEIHYMDTFGIAPSEYGPQVLNSPRLSFIRIVAKNRMQMAADATRDFSGASAQTTLFDNDYAVLQNNIDCTRTFLQRLGYPEKHKKCNIHASNARIWRGVSLPDIKSFLTNFKFQERQGVFNDLESMFEWLNQMTEDGSLDKWNVVLAGIDGDKTSNGYWEVFPNIGIYKVTRSQLAKNTIPKVLNIGALRVPKDIIADIDLDGANRHIQNDVSHFISKYAFELRERAGLSKVPQLLIYIIDKDSKPQNKSKNRNDLNAVNDIVGISLSIPGKRNYSNNVATVSIMLDEMGINNDSVDLSDED